MPEEAIIYLPLMMVVSALVICELWMQFTINRRK
jgi:hypothetical protein